MKAWAVCDLRGRKILRGGDPSDLLISTSERGAKFHCQPENGESIRPVEIRILPMPRKKISLYTVRYVFRGHGGRKVVSCTVIEGTSPVAALADFKRNNPQIIKVRILAKGERV